MKRALMLVAALVIAPLVPASALSEGFGCPAGKPFGRQSNGRAFGRGFGSPPTCFNEAPEVTSFMVDNSAAVDASAEVGPFQCSDDNRPDPPGQLAYNCTYSGGPGECIVTFISEGFTVLAECDAAGSYTITCTCCDNVFSGDACTGLSDSDSAAFTVGP